jgi:hypothetical protein
MLGGVTSTGRARPEHRVIAVGAGQALGRRRRRVGPAPAIGHRIARALQPRPELAHHGRQHPLRAERDGERRQRAHPGPAAVARSHPHPPTTA